MGQRVNAAVPSSFTVTGEPFTRSVAVLPRAGMATVWDWLRLRLTSTAQASFPSSRRKPKTSSPQARGVKSPPVNTGQCFRRAMALR